jgi:hypothetical protein
MFFAMPTLSSSPYQLVEEFSGYQEFRTKLGDEDGVRELPAPQTLFAKLWRRCLPMSNSSGGSSGSV